MSVIGHLEHFLLAVENNHRRHRAKSLFTINSHLRSHPAEQGGRVKIAFLQAVIQQAGTAAMQGSAPGHGVAHLIVHLVHCSLVNQRPDGMTGHHAVSRLHFTDAFRQGSQEGFHDGALYEYTVRADAGLAGVEKFDQGCTFGCMHRVGVIEHDERSMAAQFKRNPFQLGC